MERGEPLLLGSRHVHEGGSSLCFLPHEGEEREVADMWGRAGEKKWKKRFAGEGWAAGEEWAGLELGWRKGERGQLEKLSAFI